MNSVNEIPVSLSMGPAPTAGDHLVDRHVLARVTEEVEEPPLRRPRVVVDQAGLMGSRREVEQLLELHRDALEVLRERLGVEEVAFLRHPTGVADHARGAAGEHDRIVARELEAPERDLADQVAGVERIARRVESDVDADGAVREPLGQRIAIGGVVDEAASVEVSEQVHAVNGDRRVSRRLDRFGSPRTYHRHG